MPERKYSTLVNLFIAFPLNFSDSYFLDLKLFQKTKLFWSIWSIPCEKFFTTTMQINSVFGFCEIYLLSFDFAIPTLNFIIFNATFNKIEISSHFSKICGEKSKKSKFQVEKLRFHFKALCCCFAIETLKFGCKNLKIKV